MNDKDDRPKKRRIAIPPLLPPEHYRAISDHADSLPGDRVLYVYDEQTQSITIAAVKGSVFVFWEAHGPIGLHQAAALSTEKQTMGVPTEFLRTERMAGDENGQPRLH